MRSEMIERSSQYLFCASHALKLPGILCAFESKIVAPESKHYFTTKGCMALLSSIQISNKMQLLYVDHVNRYIFPPLGEQSWPVKGFTFFSTLIRAAKKWALSAHQVLLGSVGCFLTLLRRQNVFCSTCETTLCWCWWIIFDWCFGRRKNQYSE